MEYKPFKDIKLSRLGLGAMRLPQTAPGFGGPIDRPAAREMIEYAYNHGVNYFDTAYVYHNGESEVVLGEVLSQYPRDSYYLATKFYVHAGVPVEQMFEEQLKRLQTDHIDFYLVHGVDDSCYDAYEKSGCVDFLKRMKAEGKITWLGFSSHCSPDYLKKTLAWNDDWDFVQIQCNYFDWKFGTTAEEYRILEEKNLPIVVMEPIRGGKLATLSDDALKVLSEKRPERSAAAWALSWVRHLPQIQVILSGMSTLSQMQENIALFDRESEFTAEDEQTCEKAAEAFKKEVSVPCTACRYCCGTCPAKIEIPEYMNLYNRMKLDGPMAVVGAKVESEGTPADCVQCGQCKERCPQGIDVPAVMKELAGVMEMMKDIK